MRLNFIDDPGKPGSIERDEHPGAIFLGCRAKPLPCEDIPDGYLELSVFTDGARCHLARILNVEFEALAKEMVKANREVAIRAFAAAFQEVTFPSKPQQDAHTAQANPQTPSAATNGILSLIPSRAPRSGTSMEKVLTPPL